ncbi:MAG: hypothetical protein GXP54_10735 [Deltaproteobacteria bacterium]|nr:hypothetical protein [Deltaproteobacteria bacterium]
MKKNNANPRASSDRGMVLILALMVLLVLSALSFAAVQSVTNAMSRAGSYRIGVVAYGLTAAGSEATMAMAALNPSGFNDFVAANGFQLSMGDVSNKFFDTAEDGSFGKELANVGGANWVSQLSNPISSHRAPGYAIGEYCFRKYFATTNGVYGDQVVATPGDVLRNAQKRFMTTLYVGPVGCE